MCSRFQTVLIFAFLILNLSLPSVAKAADGSTGTGNFSFGQKAEKKDGSRWTLSEWLAQRDRNHLMDLWLGMYAPSPYEFFVTGSYLSGNTKNDPATTPNDTHYESYKGGLGAYATIIGLEGDYENNTAEKYNDLAGEISVRALGNSVQGTHLMFHYGLRTRVEDVSGSAVRLSNQFAGVDLNLYITRYFGIQGLYNDYFANTDTQLGTVTGSRAEAGLFIDFKALRVFGNWYSDVQNNDNAGVKSSIERTGIQTGIKFFF
jgi:hypothetical protein